MGIIYVFLATILNSSKGYCSKKVSLKLETLADNINLSLFRSALCTVLGFGFIFLMKLDLRIPIGAMLICILAGATISISYTAWILSLKSDAYMLSSSANLSGFVIAVLGGIFILGEKLTLYKGAAIILIFVAMFFMTKYQVGMGKHISLKSASILFVLFLSQGISSFSQKLFTSAYPLVSVHIYSLYSFLVSTSLLLVFSLFIKQPNDKRNRPSRVMGLWKYIVFMSVALYGVTYFQALASSVMEAVVLYPLNNGLSLTAGMFMSAICFKEKPNKNSIIGAILIFGALILTRI